MEKISYKDAKQKFPTALAVLFAECMNDDGYLDFLSENEIEDDGEKSFDLYNEQYFEWHVDGDLLKCWIVGGPSDAWNVWSQKDGWHDLY
jgi:hypothetical protein